MTLTKSWNNWYLDMYLCMTTICKQQTIRQCYISFSLWRKNKHFYCSSNCRYLNLVLHGQCPEGVWSSLTSHTWAALYLLGTKCDTWTIKENHKEVQKPGGHPSSRSRIECLGSRPKQGLVMKPSTPLAEKLF